MKPLSILLDATCVAGDRLTGAARYVRTLCGALAQNDAENRYWVFGFGPKLFSDLPDNFRYVQATFHDWLGPLAREFSRRSFVKKTSAQQPVDIVHSVLDFVPAAGGAKSVFTLFDLARLNPLYVKATANQRLRAGIRTRLRYSAAKKADRILTTSNFVRELIAENLGVDKNQIDRGIIAPDPAFNAGAPDENVLIKLGLQNRPYILFVGQFGRQKNEAGLVEAFLTADKLPGDAALVLVGNPNDMPENLRRKISSENRITVIGGVGDEKLAHLYRGAACLCLPSYEEGYGLPVLEAMACGTPSVVSAKTCLEELAGESGIAVMPGDAKALGAAVASLVHDNALRRRLSDECLKRAQSFRYDVMAAQHIACYRKAMESK